MKKKRKDIHARRNNALRHLSMNVYWWRRHSLDDESDVVTHVGISKPNPLRFNPKRVEHELNINKVRFQCVTISYCQDNWGKEYKLYGYSTSEEPQRMMDVDLSGLIYAARAHAESECNTRHVYAHAMVLMPLVRHSTSFIDTVKIIQEKLGLDDKELSELEECINADSTTYEIEYQSVDDELKMLLNDDK